jgi:choline dehydrogenase-like flavoprotein
VDGFPCLVNAKPTPKTVCVDPALAAHTDLTLVTIAHVQRRETDRAGRQVTAAVANRGGRHHRPFPRYVVVVSFGALNSALLLFHSASDAHPHGLANGSDQVG